MPEGWKPAVPFERCFDAQYGLEVLGWDEEDGSTRGRVPVREALLDHNGGLHGGVYATVAEALASRGTALAVIPHGQVAMGLGDDTIVIQTRVRAPSTSRRGCSRAASARGCGRARPRTRAGACARFARDGRPCATSDATPAPASDI